MPAPPPYTETTCSTEGCENPPAAVAGRYRGLCLEHRAEVVEEARARRASQADAPTPRKVDPNEEDIRAQRKRPTLESTCRTLTARAAALDKALNDRKLASIRARTVLAEFKEQLQVVSRVATSLVNTSGTPPQEGGNAASS